MTVSFVQRAEGINVGFVNISPTTNNLVCLSSTTSAGSGNPTATFAFFSAVGGTGTNLGALTVSMATSNDGTDFVTGAYGKVPSGTASILATYAGGLPGECFLEAVEVSGQDATSPFLSGGINQQSAPGTTTDAITSGSVVVASGAYILGVCNNSSNDADTVSGTGFTARGAATNNFAVEDQTQGSSGTFAATFTAATHGATDYYHTFFFAIKGAVATTGITPSVGAVALSDNAPTVTPGASTVLMPAVA